MGLYERLTYRGEDSGEKLPVHTFCAALRELADGGLTRAEVIASFGLDAKAVAELDAIAQQYQNLSGNARAQLLYLQRVETVFILAESGLYDRAKAANRLGF